MQFRPVFHAAALAAAMLFAAGASAQQSQPLQSPKNPAATANDSGGVATPEVKAKAQSLKQSIKRGTHELHQKVDAEMAKSKRARENGEEVTWKSEHEKKANRGNHERSSRSARNESSSGNGMGSSSFRRAMSKCTSNENMDARADCAREAVDAHGGSTAG